MELVPSPKFHCTLTGAGELLFVIATLAFIHTLAGDVNEVVLFIILMALGLMIVSEHPPALNTISFGEKVPVVV